MERAGVREEKLVDVLCAVQVIRAAHAIKYAGGSGQAIVVISQDIDISPAYGFADVELGVPVYAMAASVVHARSGRWLLGTEDTFAAMVGIKDPARQPLVGSRLRDALATMLSHDQPNVEQWRALHLERRGSGPKLVILRHVKTGLLGVAEASTLPRWHKGNRFDLAALNVDVGPSRWSFPRAVVAPVGSARSSELQVARVQRWINPTLIRAKTSTGTPALNVHAGAVLAGDDILIRRIARQRASLVGAVRRRETPVRMGARGRVHAVTLVGTTKLGDGRGVTAEGLRVVLRVPHGCATAPGTQYAGVLVDVLRDGRPLLLAVSTELPRVSPSGDVN